MKAREGITPVGIRKIGFIAVICSGLALLSFFFKGEQQQNLEAAEKHAALIAPRIYADPRFRDVQIGPYTASGGCLLVGGEVSSATDLAALKEIVEATKPPVKTQYGIWVGSEIFK